MAYIKGIVCRKQQNC